jgi:hypothetical protein
MYIAVGLINSILYSVPRVRVSCDSDEECAVLKPAETDATPTHQVLVIERSRAGVANFNSVLKPGRSVQDNTQSTILCLSRRETACQCHNHQERLKGFHGYLVCLDVPSP